MGYELLKLLKNRIFVLAVCSSIVCNGILFWLQCTDDRNGYTLHEIKDTYQTWETVDAEAKSLQSDLDKAVLSGDFTFFDSHLAYYQILQVANERISQTLEYEEYRVDRIKHAMLMQTLLGTSDSAAFRSLQCGIEDYKALEGVRPTVCFTGGYEQLSAWSLTPIFALFFGIAAGMILLTIEENTGYFHLLKSTYRGRSHLYIKKYSTMIMAVTLGFLFLLSSQLLIVSRLFGLDNLNAPVQSIFGYRGSTYQITIGQFLFLLFLLKYLWVITCSSVFFCICTFSGSPVFSITIASSVVLMGMYCRSSNSDWIRTISLTAIVPAEKMFQETIYLNFIKMPIKRLSFSWIFLLFLSMFSFGIGLLRFRKPIQKKAATNRNPRFTWGNHTNLILHEGYKFWIINHSLTILLVFLLIQTVTYMILPVDHSDSEYYYRYYSMRLEGEPSLSKEEFLNEEDARFQALEDQILQLETNYPDSLSHSTSTIEISKQLRPLEAYNRARQQYSTLTEGQSYLYETPYTIVFGEEGSSQDFLNFAKYMLIIVLSISSIHAVENETGVVLLHRTTGVQRAVERYKLIHAVLFTLLAAATAFLPMRIWVVCKYGSLDFFAKAYSTAVLSSWKNWWTIGDVFILKLTQLLLLSLVGTTGVTVLSKKIGNTTQTILIALPFTILLFLFSLNR